MPEPQTGLRDELLERHGDGHSKIRLEVVAGRKVGHFRPGVDKHVEAGTNVNTDPHLSYKGLGRDYIHT